MKRRADALRLTIIIVTFLITGITSASPKWPWRRRVNPHVETYHITAHKKTPIDLWPEEPPSPANVVPARFETALRTLCRSTESRARRYTEWILSESDHFDSDPFLLSAIMYDQSRCRPVPYRRYRKKGLDGPTHFYPTMHLSSVRKDEYRYYIKGVSGWEEKLVSLRVPLNRWTAARPADNIHLAAATLSIFKAQYETLQSTFTQFPYRHYVSNWYFGDRVENTEPENRVLTARRRMLEYYAMRPTEVVGEFEGTSLVSPMDGIPRLVIDFFGNRRGKKSGFGHRGTDIDGATGEPVRAVADGVVVVAGMDIPGGGKHVSFSPEEASALTRKDIPQGGGLYVAINHGNNFGTIYMHLDSYSVRQYQKVKAGDIIGTLGQTGSKESGPHLHIEFRKGDARVNPAEYLAAVLVDPYKDLPRRWRKKN
jgi:murein DD-endopeptidase MepM/ murein hydrolase activator NlpD